ncbi:MAG: hypothetical protein ACLR8Y_07785 [Alistipes indistinctus]
MKVDITRQNLASTLLLSAALCLVLWHRYAAAPIEALPGTALRMPLGGLLRGWGEALPDPLRNLAALGMLFIGGIWITRLIARNMILLERTYMPAIIFLIVGCGSWYDPTALDLFAATLLMIGSFDRTIGSFRREVVYTHIFNASLLLGIALLTYAPAAVYIPLLPVALVLSASGGARMDRRAGRPLVLPTAICSYVWRALGRPLTEVPVRLWEALCAIRGTPRRSSCTGSIRCCCCSGR